ncbi:MAG: ECF transporter S component [Oscillospiraceae bacterium]
MKVNHAVRKLTTLAMLAAISVVLVTVIRVPMFLPFLEYDPADIPIFVATFLYGPLTGLGLTIVVALIQGLTVSAGSGIIGIMMHIVATGGFVLVAGLIYRRHKTKKSALAALACGTLCMTVMMALWNLLLTPIFMGMPREAVIPLLLPAIVPFNLIKAGINAGVTFLIYKPISMRISQSAEHIKSCPLDNPNGSC